MGAPSWLYDAECERRCDYREAVAWWLGMNMPERWGEKTWVRVLKPLQRCREMISGGVFDGVGWVLDDEATFGVLTDGR